MVSNLTSPNGESQLTVPAKVFDRTVPVTLTHDDLSRLADRHDPESVNKVWAEAEARQLARHNPVVLGSFLVRTAHRIVREWGRTTSILPDNQSLAEMSYDRLLLPQGPPRGCPVSVFAIEAYAAAQHGSGDVGMPLVPSLNDHFKRSADHFARAARAIASFLRLSECDYGGIALPYLLQTPFNVENWPTADLLIEYENILIDDTLAMLIDDGARNTANIYKDKYGLLDHEARGLIKLARIEARNRMEAELDEDRAVLSMRLEDLIARSRESLDLRVELGAIKQLAIVIGVTRSEPSDAMSEFANVIRKVANEADPPKQMTGPDPLID